MCTGERIDLERQVEVLWRRRYLFGARALIAALATAALRVFVWQ